MSRASAFGLAIIACIGGAVGGALLHQRLGATAPTPSTAALSDGPLRLEGFRHLGTRGEVEIDITGGRVAVAVVTALHQPADLAALLDAAFGDPDRALGFTDDAGRIRVRLYDDAYNQPTIVVFADESTEPHRRGYIELLRQSESELRARFGFDKPGGYTIVARTDLVLPVDPAVSTLETSYSRPLSLPFPDLVPHRPAEEMPPALAESIALLRYLWHQPLNLGPHNDREPFSRGPLERLELLRRGDWSTQCSDLRYLFVNVAGIAPLIPRARYVNLCQYCPQFPDLITNSHAVAEIYVPTLEQWVMVDPWFGNFFRMDDRYLSVEQMAALPPADRPRVVAENWTDQRRSPHGRPAVPPEDIMLEHGYFAYFGCIAYGPEERTEPLAAR